MPLGKQAAAYTLASSFAMVAAKCRMLLPDLFHFSFFLALSVGSAFINTSPTFCERGGSFVFPSHSGLGGEQGPPAAKMRRCITGEPALAERKISCALRVVPPSLQAVWESLWGLNFHEIRNIKHCSHLSSRWELLCFPFPAGLGEEQDHPSEKMRRCITGEPALAGRKIFRAFRIVPPLPRAVWESPWGLNFQEIRNIKHYSHLFSLRRGRE